MKDIKYCSAYYTSINITLDNVTTVFDIDAVVHFGALYVLNIVWLVILTGT